MFQRFIGLGFAVAVGTALIAADSSSKTTGGREATPDELVLLTHALEQTAGDMRRWAYTETRLVRDEKGKVKSDVVVRFDPSKPYPEQWTPITINQKPPTAKDLEKYRKMGVRAQKAAENPEKDPRRKSLGEVIVLAKSRVASETAGQIVFEVPLKKDDNIRFPPEKFEVLVRINKPARALEHIAVRLRGSFRAKLIVNVKKGGGTLEFGAPDPRHPPTLLAVNGDASASVLFVSIGGEIDLKRTELKHVKPYDERFDVQIGTLKTIDF